MSPDIKVSEWSSFSVNRATFDVLDSRADNFSKIMSIFRSFGVGGGDDLGVSFMTDGVSSWGEMSCSGVVVVVYIFRYFRLYLQKSNNKR